MKYMGIGEFSAAAPDRLAFSSFGARPPVHNRVCPNLNMGLILKQ